MTNYHGTSDDVIIDDFDDYKPQSAPHVPLAVGAALALTLSGCIMNDTSIGGGFGGDIVTERSMDTSITGSVGGDAMATDTSITGSVGGDAMVADTSITGSVGGDAMVADTSITGAVGTEPDLTAGLREPVRFSLGLSALLTFFAISSDGGS